MGHDIKLLLQGNLNSDDRKWSLLNFKQKLSNFGGTPIRSNSHTHRQQAYLLRIITGLCQVFSS